MPLHRPQGYCQLFEPAGRKNGVNFFEGLSLEWIGTKPCIRHFKDVIDRPCRNRAYRATTPSQPNKGEKPIPSYRPTTLLRPVYGLLPSPVKKAFPAVYSSAALATAPSTNAPSGTISALNLPISAYDGGVALCTPLIGTGYSLGGAVPISTGSDC